MSNPIDMARFGTPLTDAERKAISAYREHGSYKQAAAALGRSPKTIQHQLATARVRQGVDRTHQLRDEKA